MAEENGIDKRLREVEQWKARIDALTAQHDLWRQNVDDRFGKHDEKIDGLRLAQAKWLGAIAVIAFLASLFGSSIAGAFKH